MCSDRLPFDKGGFQWRRWSIVSDPLLLWPFLWRFIGVGDSSLLRPPGGTAWLGSIAARQSPARRCCNGYPVGLIRLCCRCLVTGSTPMGHQLRHRG